MFVCSNDVLFKGFSEYNGLLFVLWRHDLSCLEVEASWSFTEIGHKMTELDASHKNPIKASPSELPDKKIFCKGRFWMLDFQKFHKLLIELLMPSLPDLIPDDPILIDFRQ